MKDMLWSFLSGTEDSNGNSEEYSRSNDENRFNDRISIGKKVPRAIKNESVIGNVEISNKTDDEREI